MLRTLDLDSAIRTICQTPSEFDGVLKLAEAKMAECGLKADKSRGFTKAPKHTGRRNPLAGQFKGSADLNVRSLMDWIESITPASPLDENADAATKEANAELLDAHQKLIAVHATLAGK